MMVRDHRYWYNAFLWGEAPLLYALDKDPRLTNNIAANQPELCRQLHRLGLKDVGAEIPEYLKTMASAREPGCTPLGQ